MQKLILQSFFSVRKNSHNINELLEMKLVRDIIENLNHSHHQVGFQACENDFNHVLNFALNDDRSWISVLNRREFSICKTGHQSKPFHYDTHNR